MNKRNVFIVYNDTRKDFSKAAEYGNLKDVFSSVGQYNPDRLIEHARSVLSKAQEGDYLLMVGDPALCSICSVVMVERVGQLNLLRWDNRSFTYHPLLLNFEWED